MKNYFLPLCFMIMACHTPSSSSDTEQQTTHPSTYRIALQKAEGSEMAEAWIDNSTEKTVFFFWNNQTDSLPPQQGKSVSLPIGDYVLAKGEASPIPFSITKSGLLNLTGGEYVRWKDVYSKRNIEIPKGIVHEDSIQLDGNKYYGDLKMYGKDHIYISKDWDYPIANPFPDTVNMEGKPYIIKSKLFRKEDFKKDYTELMEIDKELFDSLLQDMLSQQPK